jgi:hypothetical protein
LRKKIYISRIIAGFLLLIFSLGITQKRVLHNLFADHIDCKFEKSNVPYPLIYSGYNCDTDNFVAESVFMSDGDAIAFPRLVDFAPYTPVHTALSFVNRIYIPLRGPPALHC